MVVSDLRGQEALPLFQAMSSQVDGCIVSIGAINANQALYHAAALCQMAAANASSIAVQKLVANSVDIVVQVTRYKGDEVVVDSVHEVMGASGDGYSTRELFVYDYGQGFSATGIVPRFYAELEDRGIEANPSIFSS